MKINYFIDSENVGDSWVSLLTAADDDDELLVFYTLKSPHMNYKNVVLLKQSPKEVCFIECSGGNNGLDFQLCTELGYRISKDPDDDYIIFSNDTGFDAVVKYWVARGIHVSRAKSRIDPAPQQKVTEKEPQTPAVSVTAAANENAVKNALPREAKKQESLPEKNAAKKPAENGKKEKSDNSGKHPASEKQNGKSGQNQNNAIAPVQEKKPQKKQHDVPASPVSEKADEPDVSKNESVKAETSVPSEPAVQTAADETPDVKALPQEADPSAVSAESVPAPQTEVPSENTNENARDVSPEPDTAPASDPLPSASEQPAPEEKLPEKAVSADTITEDMKELLYCVGKDDLATLHEALKQTYGDERCKNIYKAFKPEAAYKDYLADHVELSVEEKQELYCRILFYVQVPEKNIPEDFRSFLMSSWTKKKNLNSLRALLLEHYGKDTGSEYYNLVKAHVKILDKFK